MIDDHVWTRVIERMALCRTNCSIPQSREVRVDSPVSARRKGEGDASLNLRRRRSVVADDTTGSCLACCLATEKKMGRTGFFRVDPGWLG